MNTRIKHLLFFFSFFVFSCSAPQPKVNVYDLAGTWQASEGPILYEAWHIRPDSSLHGISFSVNQADTLLLEEMRIDYVEDNWHLFVHIPDEGSSEETAFALVKQEKSSWVFENAENEYPNRIIYNILSDSTLYARIENMRGNQQKEFHFKRIGHDVRPTDHP